MPFGSKLRSSAVVAAVLCLVGPASAARPVDGDAVATREPAGPRFASLDGIDADLVYEKMAIDVRASIVRLRIAKSDGGSGICMGALVDRRFVVTAGHCLRGAAKVEASRQPKRDGERQIAKVHSWIVHPQADTGGVVANRLPETRRRPSMKTVNQFRDLGVVVLAEDFPGTRASLKLPEPHALADWNRSAAVLGFDRDRVSRALTDGLSLIPLNDVRGIPESGGSVYAGSVGVVFDHELKDVPVPPRLAYCQGDSGAPVLSHLRLRTSGSTAARYDVRLIGVAALGSRPVTRPGRSAMAQPVDCFRTVVWFSLVNPVVRTWLDETEAVLKRRRCGEAPTDPWCGEGGRPTVGP